MSIVEQYPLSAEEFPALLSDLIAASRAPYLSRLRDAVLVRSAVSGVAAVQALHLILVEHAPVPADASLTLVCAICTAPDGSRPIFPCRTAELSLSVLRAALLDY